MGESAWIAAGASLTAVWLPVSALLLQGLRKTLPLEDFLALHEDQALANAGPRDGSVASAGAVASAGKVPSVVSAGPARPDSPTLSVVVTACNEAEEIEASVRSLLRQDFPGLEIVVVDDRSEDATGAILDRIAAEPGAAGRLVVRHNRDLPPGRLGKCHACALGAAQATGEWILFADGDVRFATPDLLSRTLFAAIRARLDHVAVLPDLRPQTLLTEATTNAFGWIDLLGVRAYEMDKDAARGGGGVGAFNLVRRSAYDRIGGHDALLMDVADDYKLGRLLKESGARQRLFFGRGLVLCRWQKSALAVVKGLEKNFFGGFDYSLVKTAIVWLLLAASTFGPTALFLGALGGGVLPGETRSATAAVAALLVQLLSVVVGHAAFGDRNGGRFAAVLLFPAGFALVLAAIANSTWRTLRRGGVVWRGTLYPLAELRRGLVPPRFGRRFRDVRTT